MIKGLNNELTEALRELFPELPAADITVVKTAEAGYRAEYKSGAYVLTYGRDADLWRGMALLLDGIRRGDVFETEAKPHFEHLAAMFDVSRAATPTVATVKKYIRVLAKMGYDELMLYTEDLIKVDGYPYFGYMRGAYTKAELKQIVAYAARFGIEVVPCVELLSHLERTLCWDVHGGMRNSERTLLAGAEATYKFIGAFLDVLRECFPSPRIHIGFDEAPDIAEGAYAKRNGHRVAIEVFEEHLNKVAGMAKERGFRPMIWGDMYFRFCSKTRAYPDYGVEFDERTKNAIPGNVDIVYWDYSNNDAHRIERSIEAARRLGHEVIYAGGIWTMNGVCVDNEMSWYSGYNACTACKKTGVKHVIVTMWGDNGGECPKEAAYPGLQMFAEQDYADGDPKKEDVEKAFRACVGAKLDAFLSLGLDDGYPRDKCHYHNASVSKQVLYSDVMLGLFDYHFAKFDIREHFQKKYEALTSVTVPAGYEALFGYHLKLCRVLLDKCDMGLRLTKAYKDGDRGALSAICAELDALEEAYTALGDAAAALWYRNNKPQGFEPFDLRLGGMAVRMKRAKERISAYLAGEADSLPELEEERKFFAYGGQVEEYPLFSFWNFDRIFTANGI